MDESRPLSLHSLFQSTLIREAAHETLDETGFFICLIYVAVSSLYLYMLTCC